VAQSLGLDHARGALVKAVEPKGPAALAGIQAGDILLRYDGQEIASASDLPRLVGNTPPGKQVNVEVWRRGKRHALPLTVADLSVSSLSQSGETTPVPASADTSLKAWGLRIDSLTPQQRQARGLGRTGVLITGAEGPAARAGLRAGDAILSAANSEVSSVAELQQQLKDSGKPVALLVQREQWVQYVVLKP
jgi:serine protease Do